ncbi:hypothetical protein GOODEAATRI_000406 [Goodea atripinnis]|uniref:Uncharacterized protein n=1 Tax=Goodea atripinnis TaxID=208336 RepID=A0ABV0MDV6_9TELE
MGRGAAEYDSCSSFMSSELESTSCFDSEDDDATSRSDVEYSFPEHCEPIRPIDPAAWVSHTAAMTGVYPPYGMSPSMSTVTSTSSSISSSIPETERFDDFHLSIHSDMATVAKAMACPESGLEVRDRMWLKITIANAFIGMFIREDMAHLSLHDHDGSSGGASDQDTVPPLPHPGAAPWPMPLPYQFPILHPYDLPQPFHGGPGAGRSSGSNCSKNEGRKSGGSGSESEIRSHRAPSERSVAPPSERSIRSSVSHRSANSHSIAYGPGLFYGPPGLPPQPTHLSTAAPGAPQGRELTSVPPELTASRQSLRMAVGNAGEFFVDVM